jgi:hypothetical protein
MNSVILQCITHLSCNLGPAQHVRTSSPTYCQCFVEPVSPYPDCTDVYTEKTSFSVLNRLCLLSLKAGICMVKLYAIYLCSHFPWASVSAALPPLYRILKCLAESSCICTRQSGCWDPCVMKFVPLFLMLFYSHGKMNGSRHRTANFTRWNHSCKCATLPLAV